MRQGYCNGSDVHPERVKRYDIKKSSALALFYTDECPPNEYGSNRRRFGNLGARSARVMTEMRTEDVYSSSSGGLNADREREDSICGLEDIMKKRCASRIPRASSPFVYVP